MSVPFIPRFCVLRGAEVCGLKDGKRVEYFVYTMDNYREAFERYGCSLTGVKTRILPAFATKLLVTGEIQERGVMVDNFSKDGLRIFIETREVEER